MKEKFRNLNLQSVKIALIFLAIGMVLSAGVIYAATPTSVFTISAGVYPGAPSYTVWVESGTYFAKDTNGFIVFSGTDLGAGIQAALNTINE